MDLATRLREINRRLTTLETAARLRSASISEGTTEFVEDGKLVVDSGGSFVIDPGGSIGSDSWRIGSNLDGTTYAHLGDVLLRNHMSDPVTSYIEEESISTPLLTAKTVINHEVPVGVAETMVVGSINLTSHPEINTVFRLKSNEAPISLVVPQGQSLYVPVLLRYTENVTIEIHCTSCEDVEASLELIYVRKEEPDAGS